MPSPSKHQFYRAMCVHMCGIAWQRQPTVQYLWGLNHFPQSPFWQRKDLQGELLKSFVEMKVSVGKKKEQNPALLFPKTDSILDLTGARQLCWWKHLKSEGFLAGFMVPTFSSVFLAQAMCSRVLDSHIGTEVTAGRITAWTHFLKFPLAWNKEKESHLFKLG